MQCRMSRYLGCWRKAFILSVKNQSKESLKKTCLIHQLKGSPILTVLFSAYWIRQLILWPYTDGKTICNRFLKRKKKKMTDSSKWLCDEELKWAYNSTCVRNVTGMVTLSTLEGTETWASSIFFDIYLGSVRTISKVVFLLRKEDILDV